MNNLFEAFPWQDMIDWYEKNGRHDLPWRNYNQAEKPLVYQIWISEILLQQTQAERVIPFFQKILKKFPNIQTLAAATYDEFFSYYQGM